MPWATWYGPKGFKCNLLRMEVLAVQVVRPVELAVPVVVRAEQAASAVQVEWEAQQVVRAEPEGATEFVVADKVGLEVQVVESVEARVVPEEHPAGKVEQAASEVQQVVGPEEQAGVMEFDSDLRARAEQERVLLVAPEGRAVEPLAGQAEPAGPQEAMELASVAADRVGPEEQVVDSVVARVEPVGLGVRAVASTGA